MDDWQPKVRRPPHLVWPVRVDPTGVNGPTRGQARGRSWRRTGCNLYVPAHAAGDVPEQRILEAYAPVHGRGLVTGWAALRLHGAAFFDGLAVDGRAPLPVTVVEGTARLRSLPGVDVSRAVVPADERTARHGIACAIAERALLHEVARRDDLREAVVAIDMALAADVITRHRFDAYLRDHAGARGVALAARALDLAVEGSASPMESRFRLIWVLDAGWPTPLVNRDVLDAGGRFLGRPDLLDPERGVVGEYDGAHHRDRDRHRRDVRREHDFRRAGLEYVAVVGADLRDPRLVVDRMRAAAERAGRVPRTWQLRPT